MAQTTQRASLLERRFHLKERGSTVQIEVVAGTTTFLASLSIVVLNPLILSAAGMDAKAVFWATVVSGFIGCMWMGLWGNFPFALGPAMGLNSYLAFTVVQSLGLSWENGLACVFTSGCCFMLLSVFRVQQKIVDAIPDCSPVFLMIPAIATAPAVIMVGIFMMEPLGTLDLSDFTVAMPTFFAVAAMPFTYNIAYAFSSLSSATPSAR